MPGNQTDSQHAADVLHAELSKLETIHAPTPPRPNPLALIEQMTVAHALMGLIVLLAAVLRIGELGILPLSAAESAEALAAYNVGVGNMDAITIGSPAYFTLTTLLNTLVPVTDASARFVPVLFSLLTIALPWQLRHRLGSGGALIIALLLTISPLHTAIGRSAGGDSIAIFAALLLWIAWDRYHALNERQSLTTMAIALALGLASSALFWTLLASLALMIGFQRLRGRLTLKRPDSADTRNALVAGGITLVIVATLFFWLPAGLGAVATNVQRWLMQFDVGGYVLRPLRALVRYEWPLLLLSIAPLITVLRADNRSSVWRNMLPWLVGTLLLIVLQSGEMSNTIVLTLPLIFLIGAYADSMLSDGIHADSWMVALIAFTWGMLSLVNLGRYVRFPDNPIYVVTVILLFCLAGAFIVWRVMSFRAIGRGLLIAGIGMWAYIGWGNAWTLSHETGNDPREVWIIDGTTTTDHDIRLLRSTLQESSWQLNKSVSGIDLLSTVDTPAMRWYLRDFVNATYGVTVPPGSAIDAVITPADADPAFNQEVSYAQANFEIGRMLNERPDLFIQGFDNSRDAVRNNWRQLTTAARWWFFEQSDVQTAAVEVDIWLRLKE